MIRDSFRLDPFAAVRRGRVRPEERSSFVEVVQVELGLWSRVMAAADCDPRRLEVVSTTEVVVHNRPDWRTKR